MLKINIYHSDISSNLCCMKNVYPGQVARISKQDWGVSCRGITPLSSKKACIHALFSLFQAITPIIRNLRFYRSCMHTRGRVVEQKGFIILQLFSSSAPPPWGCSCFLRRHNCRSLRLFII